MTGGSTFAGGNGETGAAVASLARSTDPSGFVAVTSTRTRAPSSALASVYTAPIAPPIGAQPPPSSRCHWYL